MQAAGLTISRSSLSNWVHRPIDLLEPIYQSQLGSVLRSRVYVDEISPAFDTPAKASLPWGIQDVQETNSKTLYETIQGRDHEKGSPLEACSACETVRIGTSFWLAMTAATARARRCSSMTE
jgi:hypothetical protein